MTDSLGSKSDHSGQSVVLAGIRARMDVVCVVDLSHTERQHHRRRAWDEVKASCLAVNANCYHIQVFNTYQIREHLICATFCQEWLDHTGFIVNTSVRHIHLGIFY